VGVIIKLWLLNFHPVPAQAVLERDSFARVLGYAGFVVGEAKLVHDTV
jgi:hypothetical protein